MAINSYYTQEQLELAKMQLADLPDLNASRMTGKGVLANLREQLIDLSVKKGYSVTEIKSALDVAGITVSAKAIKETIDSNITMKKKKASAAKINTLNSSTQP